MTSATKPTSRVLVALVLSAGALAALVLWLAPAHAATSGQLQQQIGAVESRAAALSGQVGAASHQVATLGAGAATLSAKVDSLQADLDAKRLELLKLRSQLAVSRARLAKLEAAQARAESVLTQQMVGSYEGDQPDIVSVVLESTGFSNLLERLAFAQRIGNQDAQVVGRVRATRRAVAAEATRLGRLSLRQQKLTTSALYERNQVDRDRLALLSQQLVAIRTRDAKAGQLSATRGQLSSLHDQLNKLIAQQAAAAAPSTGSGAPGAGPTQPASGHPSSSGGFTFPLPTSAASPPSTWSLDDGVDISAPGGTPEYAVCSGTVVLHGIGGFGPSAPVIHCDSPLSGYDYVYYGHAGPGDWVAVGTHVNQGQVVSQVGYGIVGISTGPHLEMGFADSSGSPVGPGSAPAMSALLHAAYGG